MSVKYNGLQGNPSDTSQLLNGSEVTNIKINAGQLKYPEKFSIPIETLVSIVSKCQERTFSEEIDYLEELGYFYLSHFTKKELLLLSFYSFIKRQKKIYS